MDFGKGFTLGIAAALTVVVGLLAYDARELPGMYRDIGNMTLPLLTRITLSKAWLVGAPAGGLAACVALFSARPRALAPYVALAVLMLAVVVLTWFCPRMPIMQLAGSIQP